MLVTALYKTMPRCMMYIAPQGQSSFGGKTCVRVRARVRGSGVVRGDLKVRVWVWVWVRARVRVRVSVRVGVRDGGQGGLD